MDFNTLVNKALEAALKDAADRRTSAEYQGAWNDGGAADIERQVTAYKDGRTGIVSEFLQKYYNQVQKETDPDWATYQRLRGKFENA